MDIKTTLLSSKCHSLRKIVCHHWKSESKKDCQNYEFNVSHFFVSRSSLPNVPFILKSVTKPVQKLRSMNILNAGANAKSNVIIVMLNRYVLCLVQCTNDACKSIAPAVSRMITITESKILLSDRLLVRYILAVTTTSVVL